MVNQTTDFSLDNFFLSVTQSPLSALLLDYDGTLAPFRVKREEAVPYEGVCGLLQEITNSGRTRLVIITGRDAHEIPLLLKIAPCPEIWGSHGLQRLRPSGSCEMPELDDRALSAISEAERWLAREGLQNLAESKPGSLAVHWRSLDGHRASQVRERVLLGMFPIAQRASLSVLEFDGGIELRVPARDKGDAIRTLMHEVGTQTPIAFLGDDITDERGFRTLRGSGLTVLVRTQPRKTTAQLWIKPPEQLLEFLTRWRDACRTTPTSSTAIYSGRDLP